MDPINPSRPDNAFSSQPPASSEIQSLRLTLQITVASLVILTGSIGIFIFRQVSLLRRQADASGKQALQSVSFFNNTVATQAQTFEKRLQDFAMSHPDFQARVAKYYGQASAPGAPASPSPTPGANPLAAGSTTPPAAPSTP